MAVAVVDSDALAREELDNLLDDPRESARAAGLRYVTDQRPGIRRRRSGGGFAYYAPDGSRISRRRELERIKKLAVPPAWTDVWICPDPSGHIQATGRDARGRKQYRYHARWREVRDETKYGRMLAFGESLPKLRERVTRELAREGLPLEKVIATVIRLLDRSFIRIGNLEYAKDNGSFGLTTMREDHVEVEGGRLRFKFRAKSKREVEVDIRDRKLANVVRACQDLPGQELFRYIDDEGDVRSVESSDVNQYLRDTTGSDFTAKDFRTWAGTVLAARELSNRGGFESEAEAKRNLAAAIKAVAEQLGNTEAVCRKCYVHPAIVEAYLDGSLLECMEANFTGAGEACVLDVLRRHDR
jgi:DNA topoisomerase-1